MVPSCVWYKTLRRSREIHIVKERPSLHLSIREDGVAAEGRAAEVGVAVEVRFAEVALPWNVALMKQLAQPNTAAPVSRAIISMSSGAARLACRR